MTDVQDGFETAFETALAMWLARQRSAEERLTSFAFREGQADIALDDVTSQAELREWISDVVAEPAVATFLEGVERDESTMADLADAGAFGLRPGDRIALAARVGVLAANGLVLRELETDRVRLTGLGRAALDIRPRSEPPVASATTEARP